MLFRSDVSQGRVYPAGSDPNQATVSETRFLSPADQGKLHVSEAAISWVDQGETVKYYDVKITDATGATLLETTLDRQTAYCNNKNCTIVFDEIAPADGYRLTLTPKSENGTAGTATTLTFNVTDQDLPMTGLYPTEGQTRTDRVECIRPVPAPQRNQPQRDRKSVV